MPEIKFGTIYWIPPRLSTWNKGHWVVVVSVDKANKKIVYEKLSSQIYKVFPNFGSFTNEFCYNCSVHSQLSNFKKYITRQAQYLNTDTVVHLNFHNYSFLKRETFFCVDWLKSDNLFDFEERVKKGDYKFVGNLFENNAQNTLVACKTSFQVDRATFAKIFQTFQLR